MGMEHYIPKYRVPLSFDKKYHVGIIYHVSSLSWVMTTTTKLEQENLICYFRDRNGLPGEIRPELDPDGDLLQKVMNFVVVLNNQFVNDPVCMKLLRLAKQASFEDQRCNIIPVLLGECKIPFPIRDITFLDVQECEDNGWFNRLLAAIQLDEMPSADIMELEKAANGLIEAFESEELREIINVLGNSSAKKIDFCLTQGRPSEAYQELKFLATDKWFQTIFVCHSSDISMIKKIVISLNDVFYQPFQHNMIEQPYLVLSDCPEQGSVDLEYNGFDGDLVTVCSKISNHFSINELVHDDSKPLWNRTLNVVVVLSKKSIGDKSFLRKIGQILMAHDQVPDDEWFRIIPLKIQDCKVPENLRDVFDVEIIDEEEGCLKKVVNAINSTVDSNKFYLKENDKRNTIETFLKKLSSVLAKTPNDQLSDFLTTPVAMELRHYFAEYGKLRYWKLAMESCGISLSGKTVVIKFKPLIKHLYLGHIVGKCYDYCQSLFDKNMIEQECKNSVNNMSYDNDSLVIESYGSLPCDSFVIGVGLQHAVDFSHHNGKTLYNLFQQWFKGTSRKLGKYSISIFRSKNQSDNHGEMRKLAYPVLQQVLLSVNTENFRFAPVDYFKRYNNNVSLKRTNFVRDKVEPLRSDNLISNLVKDKKLDELRCNDSKLERTKIESLLPSICMVKDQPKKKTRLNVLFGMSKVIQIN